MEFKYGEITKQIIGAAMKVHSSLGCGFQEVVYQRCLAIELEKLGLPFGREKEQPIFYESVSVGTRRVDFLVAGNILVEIKAIAQLDNIHLAQGINYLEAFKLEVGLLVNFGSMSLQFKRIHNNNKSSPSKKQEL